MTSRHVTRHLKLLLVNAPSTVFPSWSQQCRDISSLSSCVIGRFGEPKLMTYPVLETILSVGWKHPSISGTISLTNRSHSTSTSVMANKVLHRKTGGRVNSKKTLYDPSRETENCGVGLIASLKSVPSRDIVQKADEMLVRMAHRGGCGCDPASGDGSGMYNLYL